MANGALLGISGDVDIPAAFRAIAGFEPAAHQIACAEALLSGRPVILRAPTGSGKSEAVWIPYLLGRKTRLPARMIHALPMRSLVNQLAGRMEEYVSKTAPALRVAAMHGQRPESVLFYADLIAATLDQVVTSYACVPLSVPVRHGNIPGGAIPGSFLVFDEIHTFEPRLGLQSVLVLARRAREYGVPFALVSATLPSNWIREAASRLEAQVIEAAEDGIPARTGRQVQIHLEPCRLDAELALRHARDHSKTIVVVNTVARAVEIYERIRETFPGRTILAHSRFYDEDRSEKEKLIVTHFGKKASPDQVILVATQVVEVGLDISCDLMLTELAPADALIQRAGRCARWGGFGRMIIACQLETFRPYDAQYIGATRAALENHGIDGRMLDWPLEKTLVDEVLGPVFQGLADISAAGRVLLSLTQANFTGDPGKAESAVRETVSVELAIHDAPAALGDAVFDLPRCRVHPFIISETLRQGRARLWRVIVDRRSTDDYRPALYCEPLKGDAKIGPGGFYVIHPEAACYDAEYGLRLGPAGQPAQPRVRLRPARERTETGERLETWQAHTRDIVRCFEKILLPREEFGLRALARQLRMEPDELTRWVRLVLVLHDVGKLTRQWQTAIRRGLEPSVPPAVLLARRGGRVLNLPGHATVSAWVVTPGLLRLGGSRKEVLAVPSLAAIAHHHAVRSQETPPFEMAPGWFEAVRSAVSELTGYELDTQDFNPYSRSSAAVAVPAMDFNALRPYTSYLMLSRWLRLSDWMASGGGEDAVLRLEEWFRDS